MRDRGVYFSEADLEQQIYFKDETILSDVGHFHNSVEFVFVLEGEIEARCLDEVRRVSAGEIFFAESFEYHCYKKCTPRIRAIVLVLSKEYTKVFEECFSGFTLPTYMTDVAANVDVFGMMRHWLHDGGEDRTYLCNFGYSNLLFAKLTKCYPLIPLVESKDKRVTVKILKYINEHYLEDISLSSVAKETGYTKEYCSKIFRDIVGIHFRTYLNLLRLRKAKELFADQKRMGFTVLEIIYKCGFSSTSTFYRAQKEAKDKNINF